MDNEIIKYLNRYYKIDFKKARLLYCKNKEVVYFKDLNKELHDVFWLNEDKVKKILIKWINSHKKKTLVKFNYKKYFNINNPYKSITFDVVFPPPIIITSLDLVSGPIISYQYEMEKWV